MDKLYEELLSEIRRLKGDLSSKEIHAVFREHIYGNVTVSELAQMLKNDQFASIYLPKGLEKEPVFRWAGKVLAALKKSGSWVEFEQIMKLPGPPDPNCR